MKKIITIIGARPQFIKTPLVSQEISKFAEEIIIHTGQHYDDNMSAIFFRELKIKRPKYNLNIGSGLQGLQTGKMLEGIERILLAEKPDLVLIYGDTNSTIAGALATAKLHLPVAHVEAGMRSYNRQMPEEINRVVSDHISSLLFCPTRSSVQILKGEGITSGVYFTGDVMADMQEKVKNQKSKIKSKVLETLSIKPKSYILVTVHRQENTDKKENLVNIVEAMIQICHSEPSGEESLANASSLTSKEIPRQARDDKKKRMEIIWPIHPRTKKALAKYHLNKIITRIPQIKLIEPVGYLEMLILETNAKLIITDSGGVQKESYLAKVPCITLRNETEWVETIKSGWNRLAGVDKNKIGRLAKNFPQPKNHPNIFGAGKAFQKIAAIIKKYLNN